VGVYPHRREVVSRRRVAILAAAALALAAGSQAAAAQAELVVCLDENLAPDSFHHGEASGGFDLAVSEAVAKRLGLALRVQWYESKLDMDSSSTLSANALLSDGRCALVAGYPLVRDALGKPGVETVRMPDYDGAKPADRRRRVALGTLAPSRPYHQAPLAFVLGPTVPARPMAHVADLQGLRLGIESATLADAILMSYGEGRLVERITHVIPGRDELLPRLEQGQFDATLLPLRRFDLYRAEHPDTKLRLAGYYERIGFNMGFVGLSTETELLERVDEAVGAMLADGELPPLAQAAGMTYVAPRQPDVLESLSLRDLGGD
jgi:ABC-type amino acid transport substrate-binding protein